MSRLHIMDAAFHYASTDTSRDQYVLLAFAWDTEPATMEDIAHFVSRRADLIPELNKRIREVPGNLDYPRWVRDHTPKEARVDELQAQSWGAVQDAVGRLVRQPVDATSAAWRVHVAPAVRGVPHTDGSAAVVVFQVSHALADGRGASQIARKLFAQQPVRPTPSDDTSAASRSLLPAA
ncbi:MAG: wax ester/triacylglycerol synthase domain-containing protein, partial [Rhodococcus sp. (in: high G+C Gram-positive bacteria)]